MFKLTVLLLLLSTFTLFSQPNIQLKGTLIVEGIATDGIVLAADSRIAIVIDGVNVAYIDSMPKIFLLNNLYPVATSGHLQLHGKPYSYIFEDFYDSVSKGKEIPIPVLTYFLRTYVQSIDTAFDNKFFIAGFYQGHPNIGIFSHDTIGNFHEGATVSETDGSSYLDPYYEKPHTAIELAAIFEKIIKHYSIDKHK